MLRALIGFWDQEKLSESSFIECRVHNTMNSNTHAMKLSGHHRDADRSHFGISRGVHGEGVDGDVNHAVGIHGDRRSDNIL